ncbi:MAG: hypothetical protein WBX17_03330 [Microbacterium sp.]
MMNEERVLRHPLFVVCGEASMQQLLKRAVLGAGGPACRAA